MGHFLTRNRYTRHDAPLSVRRGYRPSEIDDLLGAAGLTPVRHAKGPFGRYAIAAVHAPVGDGAENVEAEAAPPGPVGARE